MNDDFTADLFVTTTNNFEIWLGSESKHKFIYNNTIEHPPGAQKIGQSIFVDLELRGKMDLITPVCYNRDCSNSSLLVYSDGEWYNLEVNFKDDNNNVWKFYEKPGTKYTDVITLRSGDFNMDGYPDILATLSLGENGPAQSVLMENVPSTTVNGKFSRTYAIRWNILDVYKNGSVMAAFFDFYQDGVLDIIVVTFDGKEYKAAAYKNSLDYDANFIKVMVLTGLTNKNNAMIMGRVSKKRRTYGTNLPGPRISYRTTTQEGYIRHAVSAQLPQSAHFSLNLPYIIFGLGKNYYFENKNTFYCLDIKSHINLQN